MKSLPRCTGKHLMVVLIVMVGMNGPDANRKASRRKRVFSDHLIAVRCFYYRCQDNSMSSFRRVAAFSKRCARCQAFGRHQVAVEVRRAPQLSMRRHSPWKPMI